MNTSRPFKQVSLLAERLSSWIKDRPWSVPLAAILLIYWRLPLTYFEQDEWQAFETYINTSHRPITDCWTVQRPLTCVVNTVEWHLFGLNASYYALFSLLLIGLSVFILYRFLCRWRITSLKAATIASIFPLITVGSQAITWFGAFSASLPCFLFALLSVDFLTRDVEKPSWHFRIASVVSALVSLYFKEESLWLFPVLLAAWWTFSLVINAKRTVKSAIRHIGLLLVAIIVFLFFERMRQVSGQSFTGLVSTSDPSKYVRDVISALYLLPLSHLVHIIIPPEIMYVLSGLTGLTISYLSYLLSGALILLFVVIIAVRKTVERPLMCLFFIWALTGFVSYAIFGKNPEFLEGRYYFATQLPVVGLLVLGLLPQKVKSIHGLNTIGVGFLLFIVLLNAGMETKHLNSAVAIARERKNILTYIRKHTGPLPKRAIIYTPTSNYGYVGQEAAILPFQNGLGTTLRVIYQGYNQDYRKLSKKQAYLWNLLNQGYDEVDGVGFGYFREYDKLVDAVAKNHIPIDNVYSFNYAGKDITNITSLIRGRLAVDPTKLVAINRESWKITSSNDKGVDPQHNVQKAIDDDTRSDWATSHTVGQYLEIDLGRPVERVSTIVLRTADGNSFPRIYNFSYSPDGTKWIDDFTDTGILVNTADTPIVFGPKTIRKFRITITDSRKTIFAWSVSNIAVFTSP